MAQFSSTLTTLVSFTGTNGANPVAGLIADAAGNLYGTAEGGGSAGDGTVFELAKGATAVTTLASFTGANGANPVSDLILDGAGNLYGTTGGISSGYDSTVFELAKGATAVTTIASLSSFLAGSGGLITDAAGNLYGTAPLDGNPPYGAVHWTTGVGTVFELAKGATAVTTLARFPGTGADGMYPTGGLIADAAGNLYGTAEGGGNAGDGTVFELAKGATAVTTLASFTGIDGSTPEAGLTADAAGNLYGTAEGGGSAGDGTVFELAKGATAVTTLASFTGTDGARPVAGLIADAAGNLYGTTPEGGSANDGTVFELAKGTTAVTTLVSFTGANGAHPEAGLTADAAGNLYGTTAEGGSAGDGTVFELSTIIFAPIVSQTANASVQNGGTASLGTATGQGSDALSVTLTSDADFATGSTLALSGGTLVYTPGLITAAQVGADVLTYAVTDTITGAVTTETQTVILNKGPIPTITADTASPASGLFGLGQTIGFTLTTSEPVTVIGTPELLLNDGTTATYNAVHSTPTSLVFTTTVAAGQNANVLAVDGVVLPAGSTIRDITGDDAVLAGASASFTGLQVDTTPPVASSLAITVVENTTATAIGIAAPSDPNNSAAQLTTTADALPTDGSVTLANGTAVTVGEILAPDQLTGLLFTPAPGQFNTSSTFGYTVADPAGNTSVGTATLAIGPEAPANLALAPASNSGVPGGDTTNFTTPAITGTGEVGDTVRLYDAGILIGTAVDATGTWSVTPATALAEGPHVLTATQTDSGNVSPVSLPLTITVTIDTAAVPAPTLVDTSVASNPAEPMLSGIAQADATVRIYDGEQLVGSATADGVGVWSLGLPAALTAGTHALRATATNTAGNISPASTPLGVVVGATGNYTVDLPPDAAGVTTARLYDAYSILVEIDLSNASGQLLQSVDGTTAALNIYDTAGTLIGTITQPSTGVTSQPVFATTAQNRAAATTTGLSSSQVTLLAESNVITTQGSDTVTAGGGSDTIYALGAATSVVSGSGSLLFMADAGSSTVTGGSGSSTLSGGAGGGYLEGGSGGHNVLVSNGGNATLVGGGFGDTLVGAAGQAVVVAGDGGTEFGGSGSATIFGGNGVMVGGSGNNLMVADAHSNEAAWAGGGASTLFGGSSRDTLAGGGGAATMVGGSGNTLFVGGAGSAVAFGGSGDDTFTATGGGAMIIIEGGGSDEVLLGAGTSSVFGGTGTDLYDVVHGSAGGVDVISGFKTGSDQIRLFGYDPATVTQSVVGGSLMLNLADGTRITLLGVTHLGANALV